MQQLLTVKELAGILRCSTYNVYRLMKKRAIPYLKIAGGTVRFQADDIEAWILQQKVK